MLQKPQRMQHSTAWPWHSPRNMRSSPLLRCAVVLELCGMLLLKTLKVCEDSMIAAMMGKECFPGMWETLRRHRRALWIVIRQNTVGISLFSSPLCLSIWRNVQLQAVMWNVVELWSEPRARTNCCVGMRSWSPGIPHFILPPTYPKLILWYLV